MRLELHGYHERISSLRAGLRTWLDHISRLRRLAAEYGTLCDQLTTTLENARSQADKPVPDQADLLAEDIQLTEVSCLWFIFVLRGSDRDEISMQFLLGIFRHHGFIHEWLSSCPLRFMDSSSFEVLRYDII